MTELKGFFYKDFKNDHIPEIVKEMYLDRIYAQYIERLGRNDLTILDIGSNQGLFSLYAYPYAQKIYAVEPAKEHCETLNYMLKFNKMDDKVTVIQKALGNENTTTKFYHNPNPTAHSLKEAVSKKDDVPEEVEVITMNTLFTQYGIKHADFMKLDIEGSETDVIGGGGFEQVADKIDSLVFEWHTWTNTNPNLVVNALKDYGFDVVRIPGDATLFGAKRR